MFGAIDVSVIAALVGIALLVVALGGPAGARLAAAVLALSAGRAVASLTRRRRIAADLAVVGQVVEDSMRSRWRGVCTRRSDPSAKRRFAPAPRCRQPRPTPC